MDIVGGDKSKARVFVLATLLGEVERLASKDPEQTEDPIKSKQLLIVHLMKQKEACVSFEDAARLYHIAVGGNVIDSISTFLIEKVRDGTFEKDKVAELFLQKIQDKEETTGNGRWRHSYAILYYAILLSEEAITELVEILKGDDSFLILKACLVLGYKVSDSCCGEQGRKKLINTIYGQIVENEPSIPLACLAVAARYYGDSADVIKELFTRNLDFNQAFILCTDIEIPKTKKSSCLMSVFLLNIKLTVKDYIDSIGKTRLVEWMICEDNENLRNNAERLLSFLPIQQIKDLLTDHRKTADLLRQGAGRKQN